MSRATWFSLEKKYVVFLRKRKEKYKRFLQHAGNQHTACGVPRAVQWNVRSQGYRALLCIILEISPHTREASFIAQQSRRAWCNSCVTEKLQMRTNFRSKLCCWSQWRTDNAPKFSSSAHLWPHEIRSCSLPVVAAAVIDADQLVLHVFNDQFYLLSNSQHTCLDLP